MRRVLSYVGVGIVAFILGACTDATEENGQENTGDARDSRRSDVSDANDPLGQQLWNASWTESELLACQRSPGESCPSLYDEAVECCELVNGRAQHRPGGTLGESGCSAPIDGPAREVLTLNDEGCFAYAETAEHFCDMEATTAECVASGWIDTSEFTFEQLLECQSDPTTKCLHPEIGERPIFVAECCIIEEPSSDCFATGGPRWLSSEGSACGQICGADPATFGYQPTTGEYGCLQWEDPEGNGIEDGPSRVEGVDCCPIFRGGTSSIGGAYDPDGKFPDVPDECEYIYDNPPAFVGSEVDAYGCRVVITGSDSPGPIK